MALEVAYADGSRRTLPERSAMAQARREYVEGRIEVDEFERATEAALRCEAQMAETPFSAINPRYAWIGLFDGKLDPVCERVRRLFIGDEAQLLGPIHFDCRRRPEFYAIAPTETTGVVYGHERLTTPRPSGRCVYVIEAVAMEWPTIDWPLVEAALDEEGRMDEARCGAALGRATPFGYE